ncbi:MAG: PqqD family protein [Fusicatenibacter sp.]|nr:PqqD family protein [Fusicatenibacter sp.]
MEEKQLASTMCAFPDTGRQSAGTIRTYEDVSLSSVTYQVKSNYVHRKIAEVDVLISIGENIANFNGYVELNASAAYLWTQLEVPRTADQLVQALTNEFGISPELAVTDVLDFLQELQEHEMVLVQ